LVLLWGPGQRNPDFPIRKAIIDRIKKDLPNVDIRMSEDEDLKSLTSGPFLDEEDAEGTQALMADAIIILDTSDGPHAEIAKYSSSPQIATKMFVLTPEKYHNSASFLSIIKRNLQQYFYSDDDLKNDKLGEVCVEFLRAVITRKMYKS